jgi:hypothetical protein
LDVLPLQRMPIAGEDASSGDNALNGVQWLTIHGRLQKR